MNKKIVAAALCALVAGICIFGAGNANAQSGAASGGTMSISQLQQMVDSLRQQISQLLAIIQQRAPIQKDCIAEGGEFGGTGQQICCAGLEKGDYCDSAANCSTSRTICKKPVNGICQRKLTGSPTAKEKELCAAAKGTILCGNGWCACSCPSTCAKEGEIFTDSAKKCCAGLLREVVNVACPAGQTCGTIISFTCKKQVQSCVKEGGACSMDKCYSSTGGDNASGINYEIGKCAGAKSNCCDGLVCDNGKCAKPAETICAAEGESVDTSGTKKCCKGLVYDPGCVDCMADGWTCRKPICGMKLSGSPTAEEKSLCAASKGTILCGNGWCSCTCASACAKEGEKNSFGQPACCDGLKNISNATMTSTGECVATNNGAGFCTKCGNQACDKNENACNCPTDCPPPPVTACSRTLGQEQCTKAGGQYACASNCTASITGTVPENCQGGSCYCYCPTQPTCGKEGAACSMDKCYGGSDGGVSYGSSANTAPVKCGGGSNCCDGLTCNNGKCAKIAEICAVEDEIVYNGDKKCCEGLVTTIPPSNFNSSYWKQCKKPVTACAAEGQTITAAWMSETNPPAPNEPKSCCAGLKTYMNGANESVQNGICVKNQYAVMTATYLCLKCGNGICSGKENICNCPEDCGAPQACSKTLGKDQCTKAGGQYVCAQNCGVTTGTASGSGGGTTAGSTIATNCIGGECYCACQASGGTSGSYYGTN